MIKKETNKIPFNGKMGGRLNLVEGTRSSI